MKSVLCDINFFLDIFLRREPFYSPAAKMFKKIEEKTLKGNICALSFPTLYYILSKELKRERAIQVLEKIRIVFSVLPVDAKVIDLSLSSDFKDFEDALQYYSALEAKTDCIISRNKSDYKNSGLPVLTPEEFLSFLTQR
jgi:predicted nucleic acid-binding protein